MIKIFLLMFFMLTFILTSVGAVDQDYLRKLKYKLIGMNMKLPKHIDEITTMEEIRIIQLENGDHFVTTMIKTLNP